MSDIKDTEDIRSRLRKKRKATDVLEPVIKRIAKSIDDSNTTVNAHERSEVTVNEKLTEARHNSGIFLRSSADQPCTSKSCVTPGNSSLNSSSSSASSSSMPKLNMDELFKRITDDFASKLTENNSTILEGINSGIDTKLEKHTEQVKNLIKDSQDENIKHLSEVEARINQNLKTQIEFHKQETKDQVNGLRSEVLDILSKAGIDRNNPGGSGLNQGPPNVGPKLPAGDESHNKFVIPEFPVFKMCEIEQEKEAAAKILAKIDENFEACHLKRVGCLPGFDPKGGPQQAILTLIYKNRAQGILHRARDLSLGSSYKRKYSLEEREHNNYQYDVLVYRNFSLPPGRAALPVWSDTGLIVGFREVDDKENKRDDILSKAIKDAVLKRDKGQKYIKHLALLENQDLNCIIKLPWPFVLTDPGTGTSSSKNEKKATDGNFKTFQFNNQGDLEEVQD